MRTIALLGWLGIVGALLVWQGIALLRGPEWPTLSDLLRSFMTVSAGRFLLFGLWLWLGWHLFIRGWSFFLRGLRPCCDRSFCRSSPPTSLSSPWSASLGDIRSPDGRSPEGTYGRTSPRRFAQWRAGTPSSSRSS